MKNFGTNALQHLCGLLKEELNNSGGVKESDYTSDIVINKSNVKKLWSTSIKKSGSLVNFVINITVNDVSSFTAELGTLPAEVTPKNNVSTNTVSNNGSSCYAYINSNGTFGVTKTSLSSSWADGDGVRLVVSYLV